VIFVGAVCIGWWDIREEVSLLPKGGCGLDKSSPYRCIMIVYPISYQWRI
jgi:hypothetical protein